MSSIIESSFIVGAASRKKIKIENRSGTKSKLDSVSSTEHRNDQIKPIELRNSMKTKKNLKISSTNGASFETEKL